jgi:tRNA A-37 threonylcarbamoyl transferase component Bud32
MGHEWATNAPPHMLQRTAPVERERMNRSQHQRLREVFERACDLPHDEQASYLQMACGSDSELRERAEALLRNRERTTEFLDVPARSVIGSEPAASLRAGIMAGTRLCGRFELLDHLGSGGFGTVYRARDLRRHTTVALKILDRCEPRDLRRFKNEFRSIAGITHPNLIKLYELCYIEGLWALTMEIVDGRGFADYVWPDGVRPTAALRSRSYNEGVRRIRECLRQLVPAIRHLHAAGLVHRDLTPSNVLVEGAGRVVVLDFGLAARLAPPHTPRSVSILGTPAYMAPEHDVSQASDWYSIGSMLFEALTGTLPFQGTAVEAIRRKEVEGAPSPSGIEPRVPPDLEALCVALMDREPARRPDGDTIERALRANWPAMPAVVTVSHLPTVWIGRQRELADLHRAYASALSGRITTIQVCGISGIGKTALIGTFIEELAGLDLQPLVLAGRCHEREFVPFKALDGVIDQLARHLDGLDPERVAALVPTDVASLRRVFPALQIAGTNVSTAEMCPPDPQELRARALAALRDLLVSVAQRRPLVIVIDDAQWTDEDSAFALERILRRPLHARILIIVAYRPDAVGSNPLLASLERTRSAPEGEASRVMQLAELKHEDAVRLARGLSEMLAEPILDRDLDSLARESGGHPIFIYELVRGHRGQSCRRGEEDNQLTLRVLIDHRLATLRPQERCLLELLSQSGEPLPATMALEASGSVSADLRLVDRLAGSHLIRTTVMGDEIAIATYHDRVREVVRLAMDDQATRTRHRQLAAIVAALGDDERQIEHLACAGDVEAAAHAAKRAAEGAAQTLAFERAARLYQIALRLRTWPDQVASALEEALAESLGNAGYSREAAEWFLTAARTANATRALELTRRAGDQYLRSGHIDEGTAALKSVVAGVGGYWPSRRWQMALGALVIGWRLRWRAGTLTRPHGRNATPEMSQRVDAFVALASGLMLVDPVQAFYFQRRASLDALRADAPERLAYTLAYGAYQAIWRGDGPLRRAQRSVDAAVALARDSGDARALGWGKVMTANLAFFRGRWTQVRAESTEAESILSGSCTGVAWELNMARALQMSALSMTGRWKEIEEKVPGFVADGEQRGDLVAASSLPLFALAYRSRFASDSPDSVLHDLERQLQRCTYIRPGSVSLQDYCAMYARAEALLYLRRYADAYSAIVSRYRALPLVAQTIQVFFLEIRARVTLALAIHEADRRKRRRLLRQVARAAATLESQRVDWSIALSLMLRAGLASTSGDRQSAIHHLSSAETRFGQLGMEHLQACAGFLLTSLTGRASGDSNRSQAAEWMRREGVVDAQRLVDVYAPGEWRRLSPA